MNIRLSSIPISPVSLPFLSLLLNLRQIFVMFGFYADMRFYSAYSRRRARRCPQHMYERESDDNQTLVSLLLMGGLRRVNR
jgi:hypothetical protein